MSIGEKLATTALGVIATANSTAMGVNSISTELSPLGGRQTDNSTTQPTTAPATQATSIPLLEGDEFLSLLTTNLQNQDPLNPITYQYIPVPPAPPTFIQKLKAQAQTQIQATIDNPVPPAALAVAAGVGGYLAGRRRQRKNAPGGFPVVQESGDASKEPDKQTQDRGRG